MRARVDRYVAVLDHAAEDHAQGHDGVSDRRRVAALGEQVVGDALYVAALNVAEPGSPDPWDDVVAERGLVSSGSRLACRRRQSASGRGRTACPQRVRSGGPPQERKKARIPANRPASGA
jgi:hypothetical protein